jgi:hypothetical protein
MKALPSAQGRGSLYSSVFFDDKEVYQLIPRCRAKRRIGLYRFRRKSAALTMRRIDSPLQVERNDGWGLESFSRIPCSKSAKKTHSVLKGARS